MPVCSVPSTRCIAMTKTALVIQHIQDDRLSMVHHFLLGKSLCKLMPEMLRPSQRRGRGLDLISWSPDNRFSVEAGYCFSLQCYILSVLSDIVMMRLMLRSLNAINYILLQIKASKPGARTFLFEWIPRLPNVKDCLENDCDIHSIDVEATVS